VTAVAHKLARLIYKMMTKGLKYVQRGQDEYEEQYRQRKLHNLKRNAKQLSFALVPTTDASA
jgi:transposase